MPVRGHGRHLIRQPPCVRRRLPPSPQGEGKAAGVATSRPRTPEKAGPGVVGTGSSARTDMVAHPRAIRESPLRGNARFRRRGRRPRRPESRLSTPFVTAALRLPCHLPRRGRQERRGKQGRPLEAKGRRYEETAFCAVRADVPGGPRPVFRPLSSRRRCACRATSPGGGGKSGVGGKGGRPKDAATRKRRFAV